ncbi:hypothetical protein BB558_002476 [Smittium angustum]|uniref:N-acetyltransferase domain-containing protein n=1 Tax=Smittium angustum TaxID=133377 RepID=A0A2U1J8K7_SMIAN|nr:hypothetical protein BB558_002476 [Smittium angustum]
MNSQEQILDNKPSIHDNIQNKTTLIPIKSEIQNISNVEKLSKQNSNYRLRQITEKKEWQVLSILQLSNSDFSPRIKKLKRKLQLRRLKRMIGAPMLTNIDDKVLKMVKNPSSFDPWVLTENDELSKQIVKKQSELINKCKLIFNQNHPNGIDFSISQGLANLVDKENQFKKQTPYENSFASRIYGRGIFYDKFAPHYPRISPFHGRILRPFIWSYQLLLKNFPVFMKMLYLIKSHSHPFLNRHETYKPSPEKVFEYIDFCYFNSKHLYQVNELLVRTFWPGIDMSEALMYPEYSVIALYKNIVVGCAFLTADAYLNYVAVLPGWENAQIATYMLFFLFQSASTKDITLHVSASNNAMILYQKFGFKPEKFVIGFYSMYLPKDSKQCRDAYFMRLRRT